MQRNQVLPPSEIWKQILYFVERESYSPSPGKLAFTIPLVCKKWNTIFSAERTRRDEEDAPFGDGNFMFMCLTTFVLLEELKPRIEFDVREGVGWYYLQLSKRGDDTIHAEWTESYDRFTVEKAIAFAKNNPQLRFPIQHTDLTREETYKLVMELKKTGPAINITNWSVDITKHKPERFGWIIFLLMDVERRAGAGERNVTRTLARRRPDARWREYFGKIIEPFLRILPKGHKFKREE